MSFVDNYNTIGPGVGAGAGPLNILSQPSNTAGGIASFLGSNPNLATLGAGGVAAGVGAFEAGQGLPFQGQLNTAGQNLVNTAGQADVASGQLGAEAQTLINPEITGQLPPGAQAEVQQYIQQQNAAVKSRYASLGQTGSTMETDALNQVQQQGLAQTFQIAQQMAQQGIQLSGQSLQALNITQQAYGADAGIYENLMKAQMTQNQSILTSIGSFAAALGKAAPAAAAIL